MSRSRGGRERADERRPATPSKEQLDRWQAMTPAERRQDGEYQRYVRSHRSHDSLSTQGRAVAEKRGHEALSDAGRLGWEATVRKYDIDFAYDRAAATRKARPTDLERAVIAVLSELGQREDTEYQREYRAIPDKRLYVDFCWPDAGKVIEAFGVCHWPGFQPDDQYTAKDAARIATLEAAGWAVTVVTATDLRPEHRAATTARLHAFLGRDEPTPERPWVTATRAIKESWTQMQARCETWRHA